MILPSASRAAGSVSVVIAISVITSSCQPKAAVEALTVTKAETKSSPPDLPAPQATQRDDGWQRMKECAERADRMAKQKEWVEGKRIGSTKIEGWQNHYSAKYGRCYVQVFYEDHAVENANIVYFEEYDLYDAFQGMPLSRCSNESRSSVLCWIDGADLPQFLDCSDCREFVKDRMEN
jgi:hypothetical protein